MKNLEFTFCPKGTTTIRVLICACFVCVHGFDSLLQLPQSEPARIRPSSKRAFKEAWEMACSYRARTRIVIPAGYNFLVHPVDFGGPCKSKVTLDISGTIVAPEDPAAWKGLNRRKWLYFHGVKHLTLEGGGTVNVASFVCNSHAEMLQRLVLLYSLNNAVSYINILLSAAITFHKCKDLKVKNLKVVCGQKMHIAFTSCLRVMTLHLIVTSPASSPNTDGVHISASHGVTIKDSVVRTGDDCISIVSNSSRIKIRNIVCGPGHGISIGSLGKSNSSSMVRDVMVDGAFLSNTDNGVRIKTWQGGSGNATNITFQNIFMENVSNPIIIDQYYCDARMPCANQTSAVKVENIFFRRIKGTSATEEAIKFACSDDFPCKGLYMEDVHLLSHTGGTTRSFCWQAYGSSQGLVHPSPCFSSSEGFIKEKIPSHFLQSF
ncbi:hypothetical protein DKX38_001358 [Salix brachista]|uniref:endo-polygalacturonase n=1 Tax=Salix brachista TaxID=2182728 RepID=A0A5N5P373_9ROSI|nr:hypothetical protein DKX38_001358 [Salix brachista]